MHGAQVRPDGTTIRWVELPGAEPARVYLHGLGASSPVYFAAVATNPTLAGRRTLMMDLLGHGISDRPADASYTLEEHADLLATALTTAGVSAAEVIAHSMGGSVAIVLAARHPHLVAALVLVDATLDPQPPGVGIRARYTEEQFLHGDGRSETLDRVGPAWAATMRLTGAEALYRTASHLGRGTTPTMRDLLLDLPVPRTYLHPADSEPTGVRALTDAGVRVVAVPDAGHNIMLDNPEGFVAATAEALRA
ncbi:MULTISPECIES: alpha/beta fold hydrolase [unclassified Micromonospora]|uniref:alpha/beta fold hydrolase n=1 Tax=unclassified Micromonospora TaxID=2617518 RepID=UPI0033B569ED